MENKISPHGHNKLIEDKINSGGGVCAVLRECVLYVGSIILLCVCVYFSFGAAADIYVVNMSYAQKIKIEQMFSSLSHLCLPPSAQSAKLNEMLLEILYYDKTIENASAIKACLIQSRHIAAFINAKGEIFVSENLYEKLSKQQMAFVLAHEIAHYSNRDILKKISRHILSYVLLYMIGQNSNASITSATNNLLSLGYSRKQETKADKYANEILFKIFGENNAGAEVFEIFGRENKDNESILRYFSTHPTHIERINKLKNYNALKNNT
jgi:hypothetical protein